MDFNEAIELLRKGHKIRRPSWENDSYWVLGKDESVEWKDGTKAIIHLKQIEANDWELSENKNDRRKDIIVGDLQKAIRNLKNIKVRLKSVFEEDGNRKD